MLNGRLEIKRLNLIIGLDTKIHRLNPSKPSNKIWDELNSVVGSEVQSVKFNLKQLFLKINMTNGDSMPIYIDTLTLIFSVSRRAKVDEEDAKAMLLNSNVVFTLGRLPT